MTRYGWTAGGPDVRGCETRPSESPRFETTEQGVSMETGLFIIVVMLLLVGRDALLVT